MTNVNTAQAIPQNNGLMNFGMPGSTGLPSFDTAFSNLGLPAITPGGTDSLQTQQPTTVNNLTAGAPSAMNYSFNNNALAGLNSALLGSSLDMMPSPGLMGYSPYSMSMNPYMMAMGTEYMDKMLDYQKKGAAMNVELNKYNVAANNQIRTAQAGADMDFARSQMYARDNLSNEVNTMGNAGLQTKMKQLAKDLVMDINEQNYANVANELAEAKTIYKEHMTALIMNNPNFSDEEKKAQIAARLSDSNVASEANRLLASCAGIQDVDSLKKIAIDQAYAPFWSGLLRSCPMFRNNDRMLSKAEVRQRLDGKPIQNEDKNAKKWGNMVGSAGQCGGIGAVAGGLIGGPPGALIGGTIGTIGSIVYNLFNWDSD